jgi:hypothetical protein
MPDLQYLGGLQTNGRSFERGVYFEQLRSIAGKLEILSRGAAAGASISFPKMEDAGAVSVDAGGVVYVAPSLLSRVLLAFYTMGISRYLLR